MDANSALTAPFVCGLDLHEDSSYGVRFRVGPNGPFPRGTLPGGSMAASWESAAQCSDADWTSLTAEELANQIAELWASQAPTYAPPPVSAWSDGQVFAGSRILTSATGGFGDSAGQVITERDSAGVIVVGTTVAEVLDPNHLLLSEPAAADDPALAFSLAPPAEESTPETP